MKINTVFKVIIYLTIILLLITQTYSQCVKEIGCQSRTKFLSYVTVTSKDNKPLPLQSKIDYKLIYVFNDRLVFYTSKDPASLSMEPDETNSVNEIESRLERIINFGEIILDCGGYHNKLCHAEEYPGINKIDSFKLVQKKITQSSEVLCLVIPFFENGYEKVHEKIAYLCATSDKQLYSLITFKNFLSRTIEHYQLDTSSDRYNGINGIMKRRANFIAQIKDRPIPVVAKLFNSGISLISNDEKRNFVKYYSLYQQRNFGNGAYDIMYGLQKKKIPEDWAKHLNSPAPECCIYFKGESEDLILCIGADDNNSVETNIDVCKSKVKSFHSDVVNSLRGIKFADSYHELSHNKKKLADCKSIEYQTMKYRAERTINYAINVDCRIVMNYVNSDDYETKYRYCLNNYGDELKLELKLMSMNDDNIYNAINNCVYKNASFSKIFDQESFIEKMKEAKLYKPTSFLALSEEEDDDVDAGNVKKAEPLNMLEIKSKNHLLEENDNNNKKIEEDKEKKDEGDKEKKEEDEKDKKKKKKDKVNKKDLILYSKPKDIKPNEIDKIYNFRSSIMNNLQKQHQWRPAPPNSIREKFKSKLPEHITKISGQPDIFMDFLGYLRDSTHKSIQPLDPINESDKTSDK